MWEGAGEVPNFCPQGCGGISEDPYGGPCRACWAEVDRKERALAAQYERCSWCRHGGELDSFGGMLFCGEECAEAYSAEWGVTMADDAGRPEPRDVTVPGWPDRHKAWTIQELRRNGWSIEGLARVFGLTPSGVEMYLRKETRA